jgi:hypothetical protein
VYTYLAAIVERWKGQEATRKVLEPVMQAGD